MNIINLLTRSLIICLLSVLSNSIFCQGKSQDKGFQPEVGMEGKDVPWIPTPQILVDKMIELAKITPDDFLIDLGSGDGRIVITAAKSGTRALGIEYNPELVHLAKINAEKEGVSKLTQFIEADLYEFDFSKATVITMFLLPEINMRIRPRLYNLPPGTRIVSNTFTLQEWYYDEVAETGNASDSWNMAYLWVVPAKVEGKWIMPQDGELIFKQEFQMLRGSMAVGSKKLSITEGRLCGNEITFIAGDTIYSGLVTGNKMEGTFTSGDDTKKWSATR